MRLNELVEGMDQETDLIEYPFSNTREINLC